MEKRYYSHKKGNDTAAEYAARQGGNAIIDIMAFVKGMLKLFRNRNVALGMVAVMLSFMGQFALFTYLRPFLEQVTGLTCQC